MAEGIDVSLCRDVVKPNTFFRQKAGGLLILLRPSEINRRWAVLTSPKKSPLCLPRAAHCKTPENQLCTAFCRERGCDRGYRWEVGGNKDKVAVIGDNGASFAVKLIDTQTNLDGDRFRFAEERRRCNRVFGRSPVSMISGRRKQRLVKLIGMGFRLLHAENGGLRCR